jgi:hypothetical protein
MLLLRDLLPAMRAAMTSTFLADEAKPSVLTRWSKSFHISDLIANESVDWSPGPNELNLTFGSVPVATPTTAAGGTPAVVRTPFTD